MFSCYNYAMADAEYKSYLENTAINTRKFADTDYVFMIGNEKFTLLDILDDADSHYLLIANQTYGNRTVKSDSFTSTVEADTCLNYWLNNTFTGINEKIRTHINFNHIWELDPAPDATVPIAAGTTFAAGITIPSVSELEAYGDKLGYADTDSNFSTRTVHNSTSANNILVCQNSGTASTPASGIDDNSWYVRARKNPQAAVRPIFYVDDGFFADVSVDLATAGEIVKQEIKKVDEWTLEGLYSTSDLEKYLGIENNDIYFTDVRTVNYSSGWTHYTKKATNATEETAAEYKFSLASNGDTFSLLDVKKNSESKYFVIADEPYVSKTFANNTNPNYFAVEDGTAEYANDEQHANQYPSWALNGACFENGLTFDKYNGEKKTIDSTVRDYIDFSHIWTCEPAPNNYTPNNQYTTTAGIMYPSASEVDTYADRFLLPTAANFVTRTMRNQPGDDRCIGFIANISGGWVYHAGQLGTAAATQNVRPVFWLNDRFFANVKVDLTNLGAAVKQEIKKVPLSELKHIYTNDELINYLGYTLTDIEEAEYAIKTTVSGLSGGVVSVVGTIKSNISDKTDAVIIFAVFDGENVMVASKATSIILNGRGDTKTIDLSVGTLPEGTYSTKIMLWDNLYDINAKVKQCENE